MVKISKEVYNKLLNNSITQKQNKYRNTRIYYDGRWFDSKKEKAWYIKYKLLEKAEKIWDLECQKEFVLIETFKLNDKTYRKMSYFADFVFLDSDNKWHVVDVKSPATRKDKTYQLKKKLMAWKYGIEIEEV